MPPRAPLVVLALAFALGVPRRASAFVPPNQGPKVSVARWTGTWNTSYGVMHLVQTGSTVTGDYSYGGPPLIFGRVEGRVDGLTLRLRWSESANGAGAGDATFQLSSDGLGFTGSWTTDGAGTPGTWSGARAR